MVVSNTTILSVLRTKQSKARQKQKTQTDKTLNPEDIAKVLCPLGPIDAPVQLLLENKLAEPSGCHAVCLVLWHKPSLTR